MVLSTGGPPRSTAVLPPGRGSHHGRTARVPPGPSVESTTTEGHDVIEARQLTKRYGDKTAVDGVDFTVRPGAVTGFLGPNGAGKSTTMRMIIGLDAPTGGTVPVNGRRYARHAAPLHEVGALL